MTLPNLDDYMTTADAMAALGCNHRTLYRALNRAGIDEVSISWLGRRLIRKDAMETIRQHYYPYYSEQHQAMVKKWGASGGARKAANRQARAAKR